MCIVHRLYIPMKNNEYKRILLRENILYYCNSITGRSGTKYNNTYIYILYLYSEERHLGKENMKRSKDNEKMEV